MGTDTSLNSAVAKRQRLAPLDSPLTHALEPVHDAEALVAEGFVVRDEASANWVVKKVSQARQYAAHVQAWAAAEIRRAQREEQFLLLRFGHQLESWLRRRLEDAGGRTRSVNLPAGLLGFRAQPARLEVVDEPALVNWCRDHLTEAIRLRLEAAGAEALHLEKLAARDCPDSQRLVTVAKAEVNGYFASTGDLPDGTQLCPSQDVLMLR